MAFAELLVCLLLSLAVPLSTANSIHGCGGFVEASSVLIKSRKPSDRKLDYSHITVELQTVDGLVKDSTQCAPNGYYFIPVYDKGSFIVNVKGPDGWSWQPDKIPVTVDESGCNSNADINFQFSGFMVSGKVLGAVGGNSCPLKTGGPSNVKVELVTMQNNVVASALTSEAGHYSFAGIIPGAYKLRASHPNLGVEIRGSSDVNLGFGNAVVDDIFFVVGYDLHGFVVSQGNPILGVQIYLYSDDVLKVPCPQGVGNAPRQKKALCHSTSNADGKFIFNSLPCGIYDLLPFYKGENTVFDVSPPSMTVTVEHHHVTISQKFQVTGFSIGGRVVDGNGGGVKGARIIVDGQEKATSDNEGFYKLDQVTSKNYTIMAKKDHYMFSTLENFLVLPNMASIDDIKAIYYDVCGLVRVISRNTIAKVALTHGPENIKPQTKLTKENGSFCFLVPPGEYRLSALAINSDSSSSSLFSPPYIDIKVNTPLLDVDFFEAQVNIHGAVLCKEKCSPSVSVSLSRLVGESEQEEKIITLSNEGGDFIFSKVFPGKYRLKVKHASPDKTGEDSWCWERNSIDLDVGALDVGVDFVQKGYWVNIISTHDTEAQIEQPDSSRVNLMIKKGSQKICIQNPAEHYLHFLNSCVFFGGSSLNFNTKNLTTIHVTGNKFFLKGEIHIDSSLLQEIKDPFGLIFVDIFNRHDALIDTVNATPVLADGELRETLAFEYSFWSNLGPEIVFVPRCESDIQGKQILFYPRKRQVSVISDGCQPAIPIVVGRMGLYVEGSVTPPFAGVNIRIIAAGDSIHSPLHAGDLALVTETGADGSFSAGPLFDDILYNVEASKPGFHVKQVGPYSFTCQKLGQIVVNVYDGREAVGLFPSVLLSLSGEDGYRNNSISSAGGTFIFDNLFPGSFYLRPLLKEYSFSPAAMAIDLESGDSKEALFHAKRVAYSVLGTVTLISGQPKEGAYVEARSESKGFYEEAKTDGTGNFRLRGLLPDTTYMIKLATKDEPRLGNSRIERSSPVHLSVKVGSEDIIGVEFVVFEEPEMTILSGHVEGKDLLRLQPHLSIEIRSASEPFEVESVIPLPISYYFQIKDLAKGRHLVQLRPGHGWKSGKFESEVLDVDLLKQSQIHVGPLKYKVIEHHHKQELTPAPVFPLIGGVFVIVLLISLPRLKDLYQTAVERTPLGSASAIAGKKETRKPVLRKRAN